MAVIANVPAGKFFTGSLISHVITVTQADGSTPQTMTSFELTYTWRSGPGPSDPIIVQVANASITKSSSGGGTNNVATVPVDLTSGVVRPGTYHAALWRTDAGNQVLLWSGLVPVGAAPLP